MASNKTNFSDLSRQASSELDKDLIKALTEVGGFMEGEVKQNAPVDKGQLRNSIGYNIVGNTARIGSSVVHAIYNEYGTGEFAENGAGRKGGWAYPDPSGKVTKSGKPVMIFTKGIKPTRFMRDAFKANKSQIINHLANRLGGE